MLAAKEKTISSSLGSTFTWSPRGSYVRTAASRPTTMHDDRFSAIHFTEPIFKTRKSEKSPIGSEVKSRSNPPWQNQHPRGKTLGACVVQLRRMYLAPGMTQYRAYFVPGATDPQGSKVECPTTENKWGHTWEEVSRPSENLTQKGAWRNDFDWWSGDTGMWRTRVEFEWVAIGLENSGNCGEEKTFTSGSAKSTEVSITVGGEAGFEKGGVSGTINGSYTKGWGEENSLEGAGPTYQEDGYEFHAIGLVEKVDFWWDWGHNGVDPVTKKLIWITYDRYRRPFWSGNTIYRGGGLLICKRKCCKDEDE